LAAFEPEFLGIFDTAFAGKDWRFTAKPTERLGFDRPRKIREIIERRL
jgi:hypothetical protein